MYEPWLAMRVVAVGAELGENLGLGLLAASLEAVRAGRDSAAAVQTRRPRDCSIEPLRRALAPCDRMSCAWR
jgi:hypothetical protein